MRGLFSLGEGMTCYCGKPQADRQKCCSNCRRKAECSYLCPYLSGVVDTCQNFLQKEREARALQFCDPI